MSSRDDLVQNARTEAGPYQLTQATHPDVIKVMITTDNHIGYMENDPVRGQDAINSFREALEIAKEEQVDMILLGGDLFHDNKPSRNTLHQVMAALREHTLGDNPLPLEYISDPFDNALGNYSFGAVNYEDGNFNVAIPVFSIHGNHDDPQGLGPDGALSALDILATAGLINYFGKTNLVVGRNGPQNSSGNPSIGPARANYAGTQGDRDIKIRPALLQKGTTKLALYGLGNLHDERLAMELRMRRVRMYQPVEDRDEYFHMLALHQNRVGHNPKAVVPEGIFDDSLHLLIWGHEHEERADPEQVPDKPYRICQPGSTVVTALSKGEDKPKCVVILKIHGRDYEVTKRELKSVRPFIIEDLDLEQEICERGIARLDNDKSKFEIQRMLENKITGLIDRARDQWKAKYEHLPQEHVPDMPLPLIRLRVNYEKHEVGNLARFGQKFVGQVANPKDLLGFNKKRAAIRRARDHPEFVDVDVDMDDMVVSERLQKLDLGKIVGEVIRNQELECLPGATLDEAVMQFVEKDSKTSLVDAIKSVLSRQLRETLPKAKDIKDIDDALREAHEVELERSERRRGVQEKRSAKHSVPAMGKDKAQAFSRRQAQQQEVEEEEEEDLMIDMDDDEDQFSNESAVFKKPPSSMNRGTKRAASPPERASTRKAAATSPAARGRPRVKEPPIFRGGDSDSYGAFDDGDDDRDFQESEIVPLDDSEDDDAASMSPPPARPKPSGRGAVLSGIGKKAPAKRDAAAVSQDQPPSKKRASTRTLSSSFAMPSSATPAARARVRRSAAKVAQSRTSKMVQGATSSVDHDDDVDAFE